jgi:HK97 family phage major capsid protein
MEYATVEKVAEGFKAAKKQQDLFEGDMKQMKENLEVLGKHIRSVFQMTYGQDAAYAGKNFWPCEEHARKFGVLIMAAAGKQVRDGELITRALSEGSNIGGGYAVPTEMMPRIIDMLGTYGRFRANATVIPMGSDRTVIPMLTADATVYCPGEGNEIDESNLNFGQVKMIAKLWAALLAVSNELTEDSVIAIGEIIARSMTRSMARQEDCVAFIGDGTETYFGMRGIVGIFEKMIADSITPAGIVNGSGNTWSALTLPDFEEVVGRLPEDFDENAAWYCTKKFFFKVIWPLVKTGGFGNIFNILELMGIQGGKSPGGYPVRFVRCMPGATGTLQIPCILADLQSGAYLGERRTFTVDTSEHVLFKKFQTCIRASERIDINVFGCGDATNPGPIVGLRTTA